MMFDIYLTMVILLVCAVVIILAQVLFTKQAVETLKFAEETSTVDTYLYVLLNNNHCTSNTTLPLKDVIAIALSQSPIPDADDDIKIEYNGNEDIIQIGECIEEYADRLYIDEYYFYVKYGDMNYLTVGWELDEGDISIEEEHIALPKNNGIAIAVLKIKKNFEIDTDKSTCPEDDDLYCVQKKTCQIFGGICKDKYACDINHCCCKDLLV